MTEDHRRIPDDSRPKMNQSAKDLNSSEDGLLLQILLVDLAPLVWVVVKNIHSYHLEAGESHLQEGPVQQRSK